MGRRIGRPRKTPLAKMEVTPEQAGMMSRVSRSVFLDAANRNLPFDECLAAVMLTGMMFAVETLTEGEK